MQITAVRPRHRSLRAGSLKRGSGLTGVIGSIVLLLGPAVTTTQAKDRLVGDARARARVATGCEAFDPGFRRIDGLDTCVKVGGGVRVESGYVTGTGRAILSDPQR